MAEAEKKAVENQYFFDDGGYYREKNAKFQQTATILIQDTSTLIKSHEGTPEYNKLLQLQDEIALHQRKIKNEVARLEKLEKHYNPKTMDRIEFESGNLTSLSRKLMENVNNLYLEMEKSPVEQMLRIGKDGVRKPTELELAKMRLDQESATYTNVVQLTSDQIIQNTMEKAKKDLYNYASKGKKMLDYEKHLVESDVKLNNELNILFDTLDHNFHKNAVLTFDANMPEFVKQQARKAFEQGKILCKFSQELRKSDILNKDDRIDIGTTVRIKTQFKLFADAMFRGDEKNQHSWLRGLGDTLQNIPQLDIRQKLQVVEKMINTFLKNNTRER